MVSSKSIPIHQKQKKNQFVFVHNSGSLKILMSRRKMGYSQKKGSVIECKFVLQTSFGVSFQVIRSGTSTRVIGVTSKIFVFGLATTVGKMQVVECCFIVQMSVSSKGEWFIVLRLLRWVVHWAG
jgi:hypothetical protein